jgi:hypothetical protein
MRWRDLSLCPIALAALTAAACNDDAAGGKKTAPQVDAVTPVGGVPAPIDTGTVGGAPPPVDARVDAEAPRDAALEGRDDGVEVLTLVNGKVNPLCVALFVQNPNYKHRKVVPNHIGLDFHTIARPELESHSWGPPMSVLRQDAELMKLRCMLPPFAKRPPIALMNFKEAGRGIRSMVAGLLGNREQTWFCDTVRSF